MYEMNTNYYLNNKTKVLNQPNYIEEVYYVSNKVPTLN